MSPKDFDENFDDGDDLVADCVFDSALIVVSCIVLASLIVIVGFIWLTV